MSLVKLPYGDGDDEFAIYVDPAQVELVMEREERGNMIDEDGDEVSIKRLRTVIFLKGRETKTATSTAICEEVVQALADNVRTEGLIIPDLTRYEDKKTVVKTAAEILAAKEAQQATIEAAATEAQTEGDPPSNVTPIGGDPED